MELRRERAADLVDVGEDEALATRIRAEIDARGPMPFARFMELALYDPDGGYYRAAEARPGREGDFLTAPELHPIFGACLAEGLREIWDRLGRPEPFVIREHGAGTGALALAVLEAVDAAFRRAIRYEAVEIDPRRTEAFSERLAAAGFGHAVAGPNDTAGAMEGVILGNEVLDALPVHRVRRRGGTLVEVAVTVDAGGRFAEVEIEPSTPGLGARLDAEGIDLTDGQTAEICLALDAWVAAAAWPLRRGAMLLIDYGDRAPRLYDPVRRRDGTLRAYVRHQAHTDPYRHVGRQDLTAHVDVTAVERAAAGAGLATLGVTTQAEMLMGLGIEARLQAIQADPTTTAEAYLLLRASLLRLLDPAAMGRFQVMLFGRDWPDHADPNELGILRYRLPGSRPRSDA